MFGIQHCSAVAPEMFKLKLPLKTSLYLILVFFFLVTMILYCPESSVFGLTKVNTKVREIFLLEQTKAKIHFKFSEKEILENAIFWAFFMN